MATTQLSDVIIPEVMATYIDENPLEKNAFVQSGVLVENATISGLALGTSNEINLPHWNSLDASQEPNYSNDNPADVAEPRKIETGVMKARVAYLNEGWQSAQLVTELTGKEPNKKVAEKINSYWQTQLQQRLISSAVGIYNENTTTNDMIVDAGGAFSASAFIDADATMGDKLDELGAISVHRVTYAQMQKENLIEYVEDSVALVRIPTYMGKRVIVDNAMPKVGSKYLSILFGAGAFGGGQYRARNDMKLSTVEEQANGGGVETLWTRRNMIIHPQGYSFNSSSITGNGTETPAMSASWADLANKANWERTFKREAVKMAFLLTE